MNKLLSGLVLLFLATHVNAQESSPAPKHAVSIPEVYVSSDSEGFLTNKYKASVYPLYKNADDFTGLQ